MKKVVIVGSASLQKEVQHWKHYWENAGCEVLDYPLPIPTETFLADYPEVYRQFFQAIIEADILFVMNEDKKGIRGYIGAESFAEMAFGVVQKLVYKKPLEIVLYQMPEPSVQAYAEVSLWLQLGWIKLYSQSYQTNP